MDIHLHDLSCKDCVELVELTKHRTIELLEENEKLKNALVEVSKQYVRD